MNRRHNLILVLLLVAVAACGDQPLDEAGSLTRDWLNSGSTTSTSGVAAATTTTTLAFALRPSEDLEWFTVGGTELPSGPDDVIALVWERTNRIDEYVQASAEEVAGALPQLSFPSIVPADVMHVTSQLIFSTDSGQLAREFQAAFGLWSAVPYSRDRSVAQSAILWVARDSRPPASIDDPGGGCDQFAKRVPDTCRAHQLENKAAWLLGDRAGDTLVWFQDGYRYELFHRSQVSTDEALAMADSMAPLSQPPG